MKKYKYIIIGGGMTGSAAVNEIRKNDPEGSIAMFSREPIKPYNRPPLTKGLWSGKELDDILHPIEKHDIDLYLDTEIVKLSPDIHEIIDENGETYHYQKLLLATGGKPITFKDAPDDVIYYRTQEDYQTLKELARTKSNFCVIGGGFIGSEIAAALNKQGKQVRKWHLRA